MTYEKIKPKHFSHSLVVGICCCKTQFNFCKSFKSPLVLALVVHLTSCLTNVKSRRK